MGWMFQRDPVDDPVAHLTRKFTYEDDKYIQQPLDGARAGNTVYLAIRSTDKITGRPFVFAAVILISNTKKDGFGYRTRTRSWGRINMIARSASCACSHRSPIFLVSATPRNGAPRPPPGTMKSADAANGAFRCVSAAL